MEKKPNEKKVLVLSFLGVLTFIAVVVGATFAYFAAQSGGTGNINVNANTGTTDNLSFQVGEAISLTASQEDFGQGTGNKSGSTYARAILTANNTTNTATRNYYVYLNILNNDFEYTTEDEQGEILLKVTDPDGTEVTSIPGLTRKTSGTGDNQVTGFDITTKTGSITIADNYEIVSTGTETQEWQVEVIFVNLDSDQNANTNKTFNANLIVREDSPIGITNVSTSNITSNSITLTVDAESENTITNYYFAKDEEEYVSSTSNTYTFSGLDAGTEYTLKVYAVDDEGYQSAVYSTEAKTEDPILAEVCPEGGNLASCIQTYNTTYNEGTGGLYYHDGQGTYTNADQEAGDNSYRYSGANPNNYVCFGSTESPCPAENLYRIIGIFDDDKDGNYQIKLIKSDYTTSAMLGTDGRDYKGTYSYSTSYYKGSMDTSTIAGYRWNYDTSVSSSGSNNWTTSEFNKINLNTNYWNYLGTTWQNLIAETTWHLGGMTSQRNTAKAFYDGERNNAGYGSNPTTYTDEIGLMYASDYGYAASPDAWATNLNGYDSSTITSNNWMYMGLWEWTITPRSSYSYSVFRVYPNGPLNNYDADSGNSARPVFYLESNVALQGGSGTSSDPYRLAV